MWMYLVLGLAGIFIREILRRFENKRLSNKTLKLADQHVRNWQLADIPKTERKVKASMALDEDMRRDGYRLRDSVINWAIEMAVMRLRQEAGISAVLDPSDPDPCLDPDSSFNP